MSPRVLRLPFRVCFARIRVLLTFLNSAPTITTTGKKESSDAYYQRSWLGFVEYSRVLKLKWFLLETFSFLILLFSAAVLVWSRAGFLREWTKFNEPDRRIFALLGHYPDLPYNNAITDFRIVTCS